MNNEQGVWIISGVPAAGKTTTAKSLAKTFDKAAVINRDDLQAQVISGSVWPDGKPTSEANLQIEMNVRNQCALANSYLSSGFTPVCEDVVSRAQLEIYQDLLDSKNIYLITLNPPYEVVIERDKYRKTQEQFNNPERCKLLYEFIKTACGYGLWFDNSQMTVGQSVKHILDNKDTCLIG